MFKVTNLSTTDISLEKQLNLSPKKTVVVKTISAGLRYLQAKKQVAIEFVPDRPQPPLLTKPQSQPESKTPPAEGEKKSESSRKKFLSKERD